VREFEAENPLTLGRLRFTKTRDVRTKKFNERRKLMNEEILEKEEDEKEEEGEENKEREEGVGEEKEKKKEVEEEKKGVVEEEEDKEEKQEKQEEGVKDKGEKEIWWPLQETAIQDHKKKWISGSYAHGAASRTVAAAAETISLKQTHSPQEGSQTRQDSPNHLDVNAQVYPWKHSRGFSRSSSHSYGKDDSTLGSAGEDAPWSPHATSSSSCASLQESSPKTEVELAHLLSFELTGRLGFTPLQEPRKEKRGRKPQAAVPRCPAIPLPGPKRPCKRKGVILELYLPPSRPPPTSAILRLLCDQQDLPPPPKIPRTDTEKSP
jgi:hypothetical protein